MRIGNILVLKILNNKFEDKAPNWLNFDLIENSALDACSAKVFWQTYHDNIEEITKPKHL